MHDLFVADGRMLPFRKWAGFRRTVMLSALKPTRRIDVCIGIPIECRRLALLYIVLLDVRLCNGLFYY
jgi:hypothetical protein